MSDHPELPWLPGARYAPHSVVGEGGTAVVYRAYDHDRQEWVGIKMLHKKLAKTHRARQRFLDEARVLQTLEHRNLIKVHDVVGDAPLPFFVMELAEAGSLMHWVREHGALSPRLAIDVAIQVCKGVGVAHRQGVIHRDLKPHNVLITPRGVCKVIDFGIARLPRNDGTTDVPDAVSGASSSNMAGTLGYMAPEQRKDPRSVDPRTDVYGIGATLYTLLTGKTVVDLFIAEREPKLLEGLPAPVIPVLRKATAYKPEDRYGNVQDLARALFDLRNDLPETNADTFDVPHVDPHTPPPRPPAEAPEDTIPSDTGAFRRKPATALRTLTPMTAPPAPPRVPQPEPKRGLFAAAGGVFRLALVMSAAAIGVGAVSVRSAAGQLETARTELYHRLDQDLAIVDDLNALGADGAALERLYKEQRSVAPEARPWVASRYVEALDRDVQAHAANHNSRDAAKARERIARIDAARDASETALELWQGRASSGLGRLAVRLGLAPAP